MSAEQWATYARTPPSEATLAKVYDQGFTAAADIVGKCCGCNAFASNPINPYANEPVEDLSEPEPEQVITAEESARRAEEREQRIAVSRSMVDEIAIGLKQGDADFDIVDEPPKPSPLAIDWPGTLGRLERQAEGALDRYIKDGRIFVRDAAINTQQPPA